MKLKLQQIYKKTLVNDTTAMLLLPSVFVKPVYFSWRSLQVKSRATIVAHKEESLRDFYTQDAIPV